KADALPSLAGPTLFVGIVAAPEVDLAHVLLIQQPPQHQRRQHRAGGIRFERLVVRQLQYSSGAIFHDPKLCRGRLTVDAVKSEPQYPRLGGFAHKAGVEPRERLRLLPASGIDMLERIA